MKINFLLPAICKVPVGGYKVVYEYCNKLAEDGLEINIIYPLKVNFKEVHKYTFLKKWKLRLKAKKLKNYSVIATNWFPLNKKVNEIIVPYLEQKYIPKANLTFATAWETALWLNAYNFDAGEKYYLIQHYEDWSGTKEEVDESWVMPIKKLVIAKWLQNYAISLNQKSWIVNNGLDFEVFKITNPIEQRNPFKIIMLYHNLIWKGSNDGLLALEIVKNHFPLVEVVLFSTEPKPSNISSWITYFKQPKNLCQLYNEASIFISPSWGEGWALPPAESMQCGCAAILTDIGGHKDYGENGKDLILTPVKSPEAMAEVIINLISNNEKRIEIATSGNSTIQKFTWDNAYLRLKEVCGI